MGEKFMIINECTDFMQFQPTVHRFLIDFGRARLCVCVRRCVHACVIFETLLDAQFLDAKQRW